MCPWVMWKALPIIYLIIIIHKWIYFTKCNQYDEQTVYYIDCSSSMVQNIDRFIQQ